MDEKWKHEVIEQLAEVDEEMLFIPGYEEAIVGYIERFGEEPVALIDKDLLIHLFIEKDGMTEEDALEHFEYNVIGTGIERAPAFGTFFYKRGDLS